MFTGDTFLSLPASRKNNKSGVQHTKAAGVSNRWLACGFPCSTNNYFYV